MRSSLKKSLYTLLGIIIFILGWVIISAIIDENVMIFPDPISTVRETFVLLSKSYVYKCMGQSVLRTVIGFAIAFVLSLVMGILAGTIPNIKHVFSPIFSVMKSIPTASLVFLFLVVMGAKNAPILMVTLISMPIIYEAVVRGFENVDKTLLDSARIDGANYLTRTIKIQLPLMVPYLMVGVASSFSLSFKIEIMAEVISGNTTNGLGSAILAAQRTDPTNMVPIFAYSLIAIFVVAVISLFPSTFDCFLKLKK